jgi:hypothetical protein
MRESGMLPKPRNQNGGVIVLVAVSMVVLLGFAALAVDVSHLVVARNELQNAADAGALAGAQVLYNDNGTVINTGANQDGYNAARANNSDQVPVDVNWTSGNVGDVQRGHWSFGLPGSLSPRGFYPSDSDTVLALPGLSDAELDGYDGRGGRPVFINAVRVVARRQTSGTPIVSFFARILGYENFELSAEAVAYRGFSGTLLPGDLDFPIAICEDSLSNGDCTIGRMINSGQNAASHGTGGWTDMNQDDACSGGTSTPKVRNLIGCDGDVNDFMLTGGESLATIGGQVQSAFNDLLERFRDPDPPHANCATNPVFDAAGNEIGRALIDFDGPDGIPDGIPDVPWEMTLPRISCPDNNVGPCETLTGAITIKVVWILGNEEGWVDHDPDPDEPKNEQTVDTDGDGIPDTNMLTPNYIVPDHMGNWPTPGELAAIPDFYTNAKARWASFLDHFQFKNLDGSPAPFDQKSIYFHPVCKQRDLAGVSGGQNYGVLARIPVLVE